MAVDQVSGIALVFGRFLIVPDLIADKRLAPSAVETCRLGRAVRRAWFKRFVHYKMSAQFKQLTIGKHTHDLAIFDCHSAPNGNFIRRVGQVQSSVG